MATLKYLGVPAQWDIQAGNQQDLVVESTVAFMLAQNMTISQATAQITADLTQYAPQSYATTAMAPLATPAWTQTQVANYVAAASVDQANGPVGLDPVTGMIPAGLLNAASTQQWPSPFWSPTAYQAGTVSATTTPAQLYSVAIPYPGYNYKLVCFGAVDASVAADDGTFPEVLVRAGTPTGQIVAFGYGCSESYLGPMPGGMAAQMVFSQPSMESGSFSSIPNWIATNTPGYNSTLIGAFLQVPLTMPATISAVVNYGAGTVGVAAKSSNLDTILRIINSAGTVIATGPTSVGSPQTATVSWSGNVVVGELYTVQAEELHTQDNASFSSLDSGSFTIQALQVTNAGPVNIVSVPLNDQTALTGATTLYIMLASSNSSTQVSASAFLPSLWVMPVPA